MQHRLPLFWSLLSSAAAVATLAAATPPEKGATVAATDAETQVGFEVFLPLQNKDELDRLSQAQQTPGAAEYHRWLTPAQFSAKFGPSPASVARVTAALRAQGLQIVETHARSVRVAGSASQVSRLLNTNFNTVKPPTGSARIVAARPPALPAALAQEGASVAAFSTVPPRRPMSVRSTQTFPDNRYGPAGPYWFDDLKQAYDYPVYQTAGVKRDGHGVNVAVLMADLIYPGDVDAYFQHELWTAITGVPSPTVSTVLIDGGGVYNGYGSFEASLDVQQILGGAPGSNVTLVSIPDLSDASVIDGLVYIDQTNKFDIVNQSFGGCELLYKPAYNGGTDLTYLLNIEHELYQQGNVEGITFTASSGDEGGIACPNLDYFYGGPKPAWIPGVFTPASDTAVTAVGGGNLITDQTATNAITSSNYISENGNGDPEIPYDPYGVGVTLSGGYWAAGGGRSTIFKQPPYQTLVSTRSPFRTVPDVGMQVGGCPLGLAITPCGPNRSSVITAYGVGIGGGYYGVIGTSVSSPEFIGALALYEQDHARQGNVNYFLYTAGAAQTAAGGYSAPPAKQYYHRPAQGFDGVNYVQYPGRNYNYIFGNGDPDVRKLFNLTSLSAAGNPRTAGNP